jgi:hypothetical protein
MTNPLKRLFRRHIDQSRLATDAVERLNSVTFLRDSEDVICL